MTNRKVYYVSPLNDEKLNWQVKLQNSKKAIRSFENKQDAIKKAVSFARNSGLGQVKIQNANGEFQSERTYGNDPRKYKS